MEIRSLLRSVRKKLVLGSLARGITPPIEYFEKYRELLHLKQHLLDLKINYVLDVGANVGQFAQDLRLIGYDGPILSFEPVSSSYEQLRASFEGDPGWRGYNIGLGNEDKRVRINITAESNMASVRTSSKVGPVIETELIKIRRMDGILSEVGLPENARVFLKMDTQGFDTEVFEGTGDFLAKVLLLMSEVSVIPLYDDMTPYKRALKLYESFGFSLCNLSTVTRDRNGLVVELNSLMRRSGTNLRNRN